VVWARLVAAWQGKWRRSKASGGTESGVADSGVLRIAARPAAASAPLGTEAA